MTLKPYLTALLIFLLTSCAKQTVEKQYYFLPTPAATAISENKLGTKRLLQLSDVQLADFLDRDGLVLQLDDITLNQAKNHLWAEDLNRQISRVLRERLNQQQQKFTIVGPQTTADLRLSLEIQAFHGRHDGLALTSGQWRLQNKQGEIQQLNHFDLQTKLSESGYPSLVRALDENLDKLATLLAEELNKIP